MVNSWLLVISGAALAGFSLYVMLRHQRIWDRYAAAYDETRPGLINHLRRPSRLSHRLNVWLVCPLLLLFGLWALAIGVLELSGFLLYVGEAADITSSTAVPLKIDPQRSAATPPVNDPAGAL